MARLKRVVQIDTPESAPRYELRIGRHGPADTEYEIWQMPSPATPHLSVATRVAGLKGRNLQLVEHRVLKRLSQAGVKPVLGNQQKQGYAVSEDLALTLGLLFRTLAPMRSRDNICAPLPKASRAWGARRRPTGSEWPCTADTRAGC